MLRVSEITVFVGKDVEVYEKSLKITKKLSLPGRWSDFKSLCL